LKLKEPDKGIDVRNILAYQNICIFADIITSNLANAVVAFFADP